MIRSFVFQNTFVRVLSRDDAFAIDFRKRQIIRTTEKFKETKILNHKNYKNMTI